MKNRKFFVKNDKCMELKNIFGSNIIVDYVNTINSFHKRRNFHARKCKKGC